MYSFDRLKELGSDQYFSIGDYKTQYAATSQILNGTNCAGSFDQKLRKYNKGDTRLHLTKTDATQKKTLSSLFPN